MFYYITGLLTSSIFFIHVGRWFKRRTLHTLWTTHSLQSNHAEEKVLELKCVGSERHNHKNAAFDFIHCLQKSFTPLFQAVITVSSLF